MAHKKAKRKVRRRRSLDRDEEKAYGANPEIPTVPTANEILDRAFKKASKISVPDVKAFYAGRKTADAKMASVGATIGATLDRYIATFPDFNVLHPFHHDLYSIIFDVKEAQRALASLKWCKAQCSSIASKSASQIRRSKSKEFIGLKVKEAYGRISSVVKQIDSSLQTLAKVREELGKIPKIDVNITTAVVAGSPNVGKSLLVRSMSTGKPQVASYPFTTKAITLGHFEYRRIRFQVIDTPGILDRPLAKRNPIEQQAIMALRHMAHVTIFIFDPTEECGTDLEAQYKLLDEIRDQFLDMSKVYVVYNKSDIKRRWKDIETKDGFEISAKNGVGVKELMEEVSKYMRQKVMESDRMF